MNSNNKIFLRNVQMLLSERGMNRSEFAKAIGVTNGTISQWYSGLTFPRRTTQDAIAEFFGVDVESLFANRKLVVPVYGDVRCGYPALANEEVLDYEEITADLAKKGDIFGLRVTGDSMLPIFEEGDIALILPMSDAEDGSYVVALIGDETTLKEIEHNSKGVFFIPTNPAYQPLWYNNEQIETLPVTIIGKVVELRKKFH